MAFAPEARRGDGGDSCEAKMGGTYLILIDRDSWKVSSLGTKFVAQLYRWSFRIYSMICSIVKSTSFEISIFSLKKQPSFITKVERGVVVVVVVVGVADVPVVGVAVAVAAAVVTVVVLFAN